MVCSLFYQDILFYTFVVVVSVFPSAVVVGGGDGGIHDIDIAVVVATYTWSNVPYDVTPLVAAAR